MSATVTAGDELLSITEEGKKAAGDEAPVPVGGREEGESPRALGEAVVHSCVCFWSIKLPVLNVAPL